MKKVSIETCPLCQRVYLDQGMGLCPRCHISNEELRRAIRDFVRDHKDATIEDIQKATGAPLKYIRFLRKQGDLVDAGGRLVYPCAKCKKLISKGTYCINCLAKMREVEKDLGERRLRESRARYVEERKHPKEQPQTGGHRPRLHFTKDDVK